MRGLLPRDIGLVGQWVRYVQQMPGRRVFRRAKELRPVLNGQGITILSTSGGVVSDLRARTNIAGLYVAGEASCTGLHGANRLASNSLLECLVFAEAAANDILQQAEGESPPLPPWDASRVSDSDEEIVISHNWDELRRFMWDYVGIVRTTKRLQRAKNRIRLLVREIDDFYSHFRVSHDLIELRNLVVTADLIIRCALKRRESRGLHFSRNYPESDARARNTVLKRPQPTALRRPR